VATAAPVDPVAFPVVAMVACAAVRAALFAAVLLDDEELLLAEDEVLPLVPPAPRTVTLLEISMGFATFTVGFATSAALLLPAESSAEDRLGVAGGDIAAGPVRAVGAVAEPALSCVVSEPLG
jgi:hypothetical protein